MDFIDLGAQYQFIKAKISKRINEVLSHGKFILGPEVSELESKLAEYVGVKHAITCGNGTDALQLALMALEVGRGDVVFCPTFTFFATAEVVSLCGATPVFVDSDPKTFNLCPNDLEKKIGQISNNTAFKAKAIISVDLFGLPANYERLNKIAKKFDLKLIEDAAQGFGGSISEEKAGSFGDLATTSFFPAKPLGCYGDGGAIFTNSEHLYAELKSLRVHGKGEDKYDNVRIGLNSRLDTLQASILLEKLAVFPAELEARNRIAKMYSEALSELVVTPLIPENYYSSWAQYTIKVKNRDQLMGYLKSKGIPSMIYYKKCMHQQTAFSSIAHLQNKLEVSESLTKEVLSLPMSPYMSEENVAKVIFAIKEYQSL